MEDQIIDYVLHRKIRVAANDASDAKRDARRAGATLEELEERVGRLTLACTAMWELIRDRVGLTEEELVESIERVDLRDGVADGKHKPKGVACPACSRMNNLRHKKCMYCEAVLPPPSLR